MGIIKQGKDTPINAQMGTVPDVSGALMDCWQQITFVNILKSVVNFQNLEVPTSITFQGTWQPMSGQQLNKMEEGQRKWKWFTCHSMTQLPLFPDDVVTYLGEQYRVDWVGPYNLYGYYEYRMVNDYTGAGPL